MDKQTEISNCLDLINDIKGDLTHIKNTKDLKEDMPFLMGWLNTINEVLMVYKSIEKELGIDLITLFKAYDQNKIFVIIEGNIQAVSVKLEKATLSDYSRQWRLSYKDYNDYDNFVLVKDFGKTWALTEEELKHDKQRSAR